MKKVWTTLLLLALLTGCTANPAETAGTTEPISSETYIDPAGLSEETFAADEGEHTVRILFTNAGKADCMILEADGRTYLIDTGEDHSVPTILAALAYMETEAIDGIFLTHTDKDHIGGWEAITENYPTAVLYTASIMEAPETYEKLADGIPHEILSPGQSVPIGNAGLYLDVLCPIRLYPDEENNNSLILRLDCGTETVLFTGDMREEGEEDLLSTGYDLDCTILKVPYHGRNKASAAPFLAAVTPEISIICSNTETDPDSAHKKVINRLQEYGTVYRTEDASLGWLVAIDTAGTRTVSNAQITHSPEADLQITAVSRENQSITIQNAGTEADLSGYYIYSDRGSELYVFPEGTILPADGILSVACPGETGDLHWTGETSVWHKSKEDNAILYDRWGNILDERSAE